VALQENDVFGV